MSGRLAQGQTLSAVRRVRHGSFITGADSRKDRELSLTPSTGTNFARIRTPTTQNRRKQKRKRSIGVQGYIARSTGPILPHLLQEQVGQLMFTGNVLYCMVNFFRCC
jgi:hypothetical protein